MGRAVGGASAAGCGVLGLGSLIIGIGLTVWLGSTVMSSTGGGGASRTKATTPDAQVSTLSSTLDELGPSPATGMEPSGATLATSRGLADRGATTLRGTSLSPGPIDVSTCLAKTGTRFEVGGCDPSTTRTVDVGAGGTLASKVPIHRVITVEGTAYDCAARPGACALFGHRPDNPLDTGLAAPLVFATGLRPVDALAPPAS